MQKFCKKHILKINQKVEAWIPRCSCLKRGSLSASTKWKPSPRATPPLLYWFLFSRRRFTAVPCTHCCTYTRHSPRSRAVLLGGEDLNHPWLVLVPSPLWPILCVCSSDCLLSFMPAECWKAKILLPLATRRLYSIFIWCLKHQTNACAQSAEIIPDKRRLWPGGEYQRNGHGKLPVKLKKRLCPQPSSPVRTRKHEAVQNVCGALPPATLDADKPRKARFLPNF